MKRILELGCGHGTHADELSACGELIAVDLLPAMLAPAKHRYPRSFFCAMNCEALGFPDRIFDEIHAYDVLEHVDDLDSTLAEVARVLRAEGIVVVEVPHHHSEAMLACLNPDYGRQSHHTRRLSPAEWVGELNRHGVFVDRMSRHKFLESFYLGYWFSRGCQVMNQQGELASPVELHDGDRVLGVLLSLTLMPSSEVRRIHEPQDVLLTEEYLGNSLEALRPPLEAWEEWGAQFFPKTIRLEGRYVGGRVEQSTAEIPGREPEMAGTSPSTGEKWKRELAELRRTIGERERELEATHRDTARMTEDIARQQKVNESQHRELKELTAKVNRLVLMVEERQRANEALAEELARTPWRRLRRWLGRVDG